MPNRLIHETSPYLLQHAHNPVDWYPWGEEALRAAREQDKPILLSIGYSACHWCHVMERESFESEAIARIMNERFINIKVDREERPDLDSIYMVAVQMMTGQGGWPLTVFLTPDLQPFYGGTYFPPEDRLGMPGFPRVLLAASEAYRTRRQEVEQSAREVSQHLQAHFAATAPPSALSEATLDEAARNLARQFDRVNGGFGGAPKFPAPMALEFLLRTWRRAGVPRALEMVELTLTKMARGGIYDQVGGGFHRYAVDAVWLVPHFEKMLYDNALLARVYALAYQATGGSLYRRVAEETCDYVLREMTSPEGAFYSTQDADSEGEEGKFYVWTPEEIDAALPPREAEIAKRYFGVTEAGNFEGKTVLSVPEPPERVAADLAMSPDALEAAVREIRDRLYAARAGRVWPGRDEKVLAAWNGLMLRALAEVGAALDRPDYVDAAARCARFLRDHLDRGGTLSRVFKDGRAHVDGYLEDYAALADGLVSLYEATFEPAWLDWARDLLARAVDRFADPQGGGFFDTPAMAGDLITRPK
ncbi:MAG: thioredoxin domain-containing protein, partial [Thermomicrobiaceae bacterium]|nr:thioredoxin domain-containing protein [Thermomicrobiaceae bacterium]